ncbi:MULTISPECIES: DUF6629 family protein [unclassified Streptomyces]|uniref:DUF6629 family protein n=1 Tax=unclassified Streptomyces TaxID=2593676 RepID=UPI002E1EF85A|nr:hypothetical protein OG217_00865 [Streptomyces sp. NBC_01023]
MCWSATADLVAGTGIAAVGVACPAQVRRARDLPLAALPLLLGIHQVIEAGVWHSGGGTGPATTAWAVIALPLLALWVPCGVLLAAPRPTPRRLLLPVVAGTATAVVLAFRIADRPVIAQVRGHTVGYVIDLPLPALVVAGYLLATVGSLLLTPDPLLRLFGAVVGAGALICFLLWKLAYVSTWCAFAAVSAVLMVGWVRRGPAKSARATGLRTP